MRRIAPAFALAFTPLALLATPASAEVPDLSGFWNLDRDQANAAFTPEAKALIEALPPNTVIVQDTGAPEFPEDEYGGLKLKPEALAHAQAWQATDEMSLSRVCASPSVIYAIQGPFPFEIFQSEAMIVFKYEYFDQVRIVFMDGREHLPADAPHSKTGHSIGHWEGDELVIDTTHIAAATITNNGLDHSDDVHMVERYRKIGDDVLVATEWFEDPNVLENNGARVIQWRKFPGEHVYPYDCDPTLAVEYQSIEATDPVEQ